MIERYFVTGVFLVLVVFGGCCIYYVMLSVDLRVFFFNFESGYLVVIYRFKFFRVLFFCFLVLYVVRGRLGIIVFLFRV